MARKLFLNIFLKHFPDIIKYRGTVHYVCTDFQEPETRYLYTSAIMSHKYTTNGIVMQLLFFFSQLT